MEAINLNIEGYWRDEHKRGLPVYQGIFFVYQTKYIRESDTVRLLKVIYVGEADNINERVHSHPLYAEWIRCLMEGEELSYSSSNIEGPNKTRAKAAFIFKLKPVANKNYKDDFPFEKITIHCVGKTSLLDTEFTVGV